MMPVLELKKVTKSFGSKQVFVDASFSFESGVYAITGPNGIGKTVLLEMLAGVELPDSGSIYLSGIGESASHEYKKNLTYVPGKSIFFPIVTGFEFISFIIAVKNQKNTEYKKLDELIDGFKLRDHLNSRFRDMSLGTQKKLFLSTLAIGNSKLIILDEPTNGLDVESNKLLYKALIELSNQAIIILATHDHELLKYLQPTMLNLYKSPTFNFNKSNFSGSNYAATIL